MAEETLKRRGPDRRPRPSRLRHGAYSLIVRGEFPEEALWLRRSLSVARRHMIDDVSAGQGEAAIPAARMILIDRAIGALGICRVIEEHVRQVGALHAGVLAPILDAQYPRYVEMLRRLLLALGLDPAQFDRPAPSPADVAAEVVAARADDPGAGEKAASAGLHGANEAGAGERAGDEGGGGDVGETGASSGRRGEGR